MPESYNIGSGLTEQQLKLANFWMRNGAAIKKAGYGLLIAFSIVTWGYALWVVLDTYAISYPRESRIPSVIAQNHLTEAALQAAIPEPVRPTDVSIFQNTDSRQDFLVQISNSNPTWWAEFDYSFDTQGETTPVRHGYILPLSQRYLTELGWKGQAAARSATFKVANIAWHRIDQAAVGNDYSTFLAKRWQLAFDDIDYKNNLKIGDKTVGQSNFTLRNPSAYGFWSVDLNIVLYRLGNPVAVTTVNVKDIKPGESRPMSINWFDNPTSVSKTEIQPNANILNPSVFLPSTRF